MDVTALKRVATPRTRALLSVDFAGLRLKNPVFTASGTCGYSDELTDFMDVNALGTATLLEILANEKHKVGKLIVASSMSIYGEGRYHCSACGPVAPAPRSRERLRSGKWEPPCPACDRDLTPLPTDETKPLNPTSVYGVTKRSQEETVLVMGKAYGIPAVSLGVGWAHSNAHAPNEKLDLGNFHGGIIASAYLYDEIAEAMTAQPARP